jgi:hypothetical protein
MKSRIFNVLTVCFVTSILLVPTQQAFGCSTESQSNIKQIQPSPPNGESSSSANRKGTQNQGLIKERKESAHPVAVTSQATNSSQVRSASQTAELNNTAGGLFVTFLFTSYVLVGLQYRKYRAHRATVLLQQIETLERIWRMKPQQR